MCPSLASFDAGLRGFGGPFQWIPTEMPSRWSHCGPGGPWGLKQKAAGVQPPEPECNEAEAECGPSTASGPGRRPKSKSIQEVQQVGCG